METRGDAADLAETLLAADGKMQGGGQNVLTWIRRKVQDALAQIKFLDISKELYPHVIPKIKKLFWMGYATVPGFFWLGRCGFTKLASVLQVGLMACSMAVQYEMFRSGRDSKSLLSESTVDIIGSPLQASLRTSDGSVVNASSNKVIKVVGDMEGNFQLRGFSDWCGKRASLKMTGQDGVVLHLRIVDEDRSSLLRETSSSNAASTFVVVNQFCPGTFTLEGLPGNESFELGILVESLENGKTYLKTENGKYVRLDMGKVKDTESSDRCLEVDIDGLPSDERQCFSKEIIAGKTFLKTAAGKYVVMKEVGLAAEGRTPAGDKYLVTSQTQIAAESSTPGLEIDFYDNQQGVNKNIKTVFFVPVQNCIRVRTWVYDLLSLGPSSILFMVTATNAGQSWMIWFDPTKADSRHNFEKNWDYVPLIGHVVAQQGLPLLLTSLMAWDFLVHLLLNLVVSQASDLGEAADTAQLMFLGKMFGQGRGREKLVNGRWNCSRTFSAAFVGGPTLWLKITNLSLAVGTPQQNYAIFAVLMSFYSIGPLALGGFINSCREFKRNAQPRGGSYVETVIAFVFPTAIICAFSLICALHFLGVFYCDSHDLSILHGCTIMS